MSNEQTELNERLLYAADSGDHRSVSELLASGADFNFFDLVALTALHYAANSGHHRIVYELIAKGADVNAHIEEEAGDTPIIRAVRERHFKVIKLLLKAGADPYIKGWMGRDAFDHAEDLKGVNGKKIKDLILKARPLPKNKKYRKL